MNYKIIFSVLLAVCFSIPSYASIWGRKYSEIKLSEDTYIVTIRATSTTTPDKALSGLLTRAAEITLNNGYRYFIVTENRDLSDKQDCLEFNWGSGFASATQKTKTIPHGQIAIKCFKTNPHKDFSIEAKSFLEFKNNRK